MLLPETPAFLSEREESVFNYANVLENKKMTALSFIGNPRANIGIVKVRGFSFPLKAES